MKDGTNSNVCLSADPERTIAEETALPRPVEFLMITKEVLSALEAGDSRAFDTVYLHCFEPIRAFFCLLLHNEAEAEELCQDLFVRLWENRRTINPDLNFRSYLYTMAKTSALKYFRHKQVRDKYVNFRLREYSDPGEAPDEELMGNELSLLVRISLEKMPEQRRKVFEMSRFENLTNGEIADRLNIRESTVRAHLHHALKILKGLLVLVVFFYDLQEKFRLMV